MRQRKYLLVGLLFLTACLEKPATKNSIKGAPSVPEKNQSQIEIPPDYFDTLESKATPTPSDAIKDQEIQKGVLQGMEIKKITINIAVGGNYKIDLDGSEQGARIKPLFPLDEYVNRKSWQGYMKKDHYDFELYLEAESGLQKKTVAYSIKLTKLKSY